MRRPLFAIFVMVQGAVLALIGAYFASGNPKGLAIGLSVAVLGCLSLPMAFDLLRRPLP